MERDDEGLARASRLLRRRHQLTQPAMVVPGRSRHFTRRLESGLAGELRLDDIRGHFSMLGARVRVSVWWNGALLDRLLDEEHAGIVEAAVGAVRRYGWSVETEVTFSEYGERGSIDLFGRDERRRAALVGEVKSAWGSMEETLRSLDAKERLAPRICFQRWGWRPVWVGKVLMLSEDRTARRVAQRHAATLDSALPARSREVRAWLHQPDGPLRGLWFLSNVHASGRESG